MRKTKSLTIAAVLAAASLALAGCGGDAKNGETPSGNGDQTTDDAGGDNGTGDDNGGEVTTIKVGASPVPHADILKFVNDNLAEEAGLKIEVVEFTDYVLPNVTLSEGEIDANYFQHVPYFNDEVSSKDYKFDRSEGIHIEPYGVYSEKITSLDDLADGATISVPNDPSNQARALRLLENNGVFTLADVENPTIYDIGENPKNVELKELDAAQLPITLGDVDISVINGNFALQAGLVPSKDALVLESGENNPYANIVAFRTEDKDSAAIKKLIELLTSDQVREFITTTWPDGEIIPAF